MEKRTAGGKTRRLSCCLELALVIALVLSLVILFVLCGEVVLFILGVIARFVLAAVRDIVLIVVGHEAHLAFFLPSLARFRMFYTDL